MQEHDIAEISLKDGKTSIHVKKNSNNVVGNPSPAPAAVSFPSPLVEKAAAAETVEEEEIEKVPPSEDDVDDFTPVTAPLVGTFYRAPAPDADVFVEIGDRIERGDVLCIVEAMKSMNEIQAEVDGVVKEICVDNAALVEFEQVLFKIDTAG
jgi:acetyl-CoA carboxylase biotin carboxyl carrier protein